MPTKKHIHIYERVGPRSDNARFRCIDPDCTHFDYRQMIMGNRAQCECGATFILTHDLVTYKRPICAKCAKPGSKRREAWEKTQETVGTIKDIVGEVI